ncbi:hypothetical protein [Hymenobacter terrenus]|uniref:hypothetical protein n=1 Tax=Hymenobacter terrenus TaxID=1629124 RepID=UPI0006198E32|nr:hypothetical protein [Hymenobacter terrenus]
MELDDLRRQWQQPAPAEAPAAFDAVALTKLLARGSRSPVSKMRRNVWLEISFAAVIMILTSIGLLYARDTHIHIRTLLGGMIIICLLSGFYYRRKLAVLHSLGDANGALREHVVRQLSSLRGLVKLYYQATMWSSYMGLVIGLFFTGTDVVHTVSRSKLLIAIAIMFVVYGILGLFNYFIMGRFTRWYIQRLYGQHLDQLERSLRELDDEPSA